MVDINMSMLLVVVCQHWHATCGCDVSLDMPLVVVMSAWICHLWL